MGVELSLYDLDRRFGEILKDFPVQRRAFMETAGEKMYQGVLRNIDTETNEGTGNLRKGVEKAIGSGGGYAAVRANRGIAPHTYIVENGHAVKPRGRNKSGRGNGARRTTVRTATRGEGGSEWVNGKFLYQNALTKLERELKQDAANMLEGLVRNSFG